MLIQKKFYLTFFFLFFSFIVKTEEATDQIVAREMLRIDNSKFAEMDYFHLEQKGVSKEELLVMAAKSALCVQKDDLSVALGGNVELKYYLFNNATLLNKNLPDQIGLFREDIDIAFNILYGQKKYGHRALQLFFDLLSKNKWGFAGAYKPSSPAEIKINDTNGDTISLGYHEHRPSKPYPWFKDAWLQVSFNSVFNIKSEKLHFFKIGWFPFHLGNGIALGDAYNLLYEEFAQFAFETSSSSPGIDIYGELIKDKLIYDLYYSKFEDKSTTLDSTYNDVKKNFINHSKWRGVAKDDELWSLRLLWNLFDSPRYGKLKVQPYILYNDASDQYAAKPNGGKVSLGTFGLSGDYTKNGFNFGGEAAFNFGDVKAYEIDKNEVKLERDDNGYLREVYSNVYEYDTEIEKYTVKAPVTDDIKKEAYEPENRFKKYGDYYTVGTKKLTNLNRIVPAFKNNMRGWAGILYGTYEAVPQKLKISLEFGHASGDTNLLQDKKNKNYNGFVGIHECFYGKKVYSVLFLGERVIGKPVPLRKGQDLNPANVLTFKTVSKSSSFTNVNYLGLGLKWTPKFFKGKFFEIDPDLLFFWTDKSSYKYEVANKKASETQKASNFLGTEVNAIASCEILRNLMFTGSLALFLPGKFFKDMKGLPYYSIFNADNPVSLLQPSLPNQYFLGDSTAFYFKLALTYKF